MEFTTRAALWRLFVVFVCISSRLTDVSSSFAGRTRFFIGRDLLTLHASREELPVDNEPTMNPASVLYDQGSRALTWD